MKKSSVSLLLAGLVVFAGAHVAFAQRGSTKTITTTKLADVQTTFERTEAIALEARHEMLITPLIATVEVIPKIENGGAPVYEAKPFSGKYLMSKIENVKGMNLDIILDKLYTQLKASAIYDFCIQEDADLIVMPQFKITHVTETVQLTDDTGATVTVEKPCEENGNYLMRVEMTGYPARYTGFRTGTQNDFWIKNLYLQGTLSNSNSDTSVNQDTQIRIGNKE